MTDSVTEILRSRFGERMRPMERLARHLGGRVRERTSAAATAGTGETCGLAIRVLSGLHSGAAAHPASSSFVIGSDLDADIVLSDSGVAPRHASIVKSDGRLMSKIAVEALEGEVEVADEVLKPGEKVEAYLPARLTLGETRLEIDGPPQRQASFGPVLWILPVAVVAGALAAFLWNVAAQAMRVPVIELPSSVLGRESAVDPGRIEGIKARLKDLGLGDAVTVTARGTSLIAQGGLAPDKHVKWAGLRSTLLTEWGDPAAIMDLVKVATAGEPAKGMIGAIVLGEDPYVISMTGRKTRVGESMEGGWVIREIKSNAVTVERGQQRAVIEP